MREMEPSLRYLLTLIEAGGVAAMMIRSLIALLRNFVKLEFILIGQPSVERAIDDLHARTPDYASLDRAALIEQIDALRGASPKLRATS